MKIVDSRTMADIDRQAQERYHIPQAVLMEDAALGAYRLLRDRLWHGRLPDAPIVFLVGKGNNGGDALVMARKCLLEGKREALVVLGGGPPEETSLAGVHLRILRAMDAEVLDFREQPEAARQRLGAAAWVIDGLLGTGLEAEARGSIAELIRAANDCPAAKVSVDIPSGIGDAFRKGFPAIRADATLTIGLPKLCLYLPQARAHCGAIHVVGGVFPPPLLEAAGSAVELLEEPSLGRLLEPIPPDAYKNARGHLAVFAGAEGTTGAAWLCAHAAARSRTGLVTVHLDRGLYEACLSAYSSVMIRPWDFQGDPPALALGSYTALLVGPGWGLGHEREAWLSHLLSSSLPGLLDADGITLLSRLLKRRKLSLGGRWVLTPHPGEFARLVGEETSAVLEDPFPLLRRASSSLQATIVLKGHCSYVCDPEGSIRVLDGMNPALATGGSGDVLSGVIAGQLAGGVEPTRAACVGVLLHSAAGRRAFEARGYFTADELLPFVSRLVGGG